MFCLLMGAPQDPYRADRKISMEGIGTMFQYGADGS